PAHDSTEGAAQPGDTTPTSSAPSSAVVPSTAPSASSASSTPARKSFLAFHKTMRLEIVPSLSRVGFDAKSTLHDFSGTTSKVAGELTTCLARPEQSCRGEIRVD